MNTVAPVFDLVGSKIFYLLPIEDILKCRTVCRQFKSVLDDPYFWLKLLKIIGHPEQCHKQWIDLIQKSNDIGIGKETFGNVLILLFTCLCVLLMYFWLQKQCANRISVVFL